jgi:oligosaccharide translocation protein RFT1
VFSIIYILGALALYRMGFGDTSLVYANIINLSARIVYCIRFIASYFSSREQADSPLGWTGAVPRRELLIILAVSRVAIWYSEKVLDVSGAMIVGNLKPILIHCIVGLVFAVTCFGTWWMSSGRFLVSYMKKKTE